MKQCIYLVILMYLMQIYFHFLWSENLQILLYFWIFVNPARNMNYLDKQNSEKIQRVKIRLNLKTNDISLIISSNLLYFNFTKSR